MVPSFSHLPDSLPVGELRKHFSDLLDVLDSSENINLESAATSLRELADRQWHTYEFISVDLCERIETWIIKNWSLKSQDFVDRILFVVGALGLTKCYELILESRSQKMSMDMRHSIEVLILQIERNDGHIEDPYYSLR